MVTRIVRWPKYWSALVVALLGVLMGLGDTDVRAGRWAGSQKTECGIHTARAPGVAPFMGGDI